MDPLPSLSMASSNGSLGGSSTAGRHSTGAPHSRQHDAQMEIEEGVLLRMRTAVGNGNEMVDLAGEEDHTLGDLEVGARPAVRPTARPLADSPVCPGSPRRSNS